MTNDLSRCATIPRFGTIVVKWYSATFALVADTTLIREDLPTLGVPINATSASNVSSREISFIWPGSPMSANHAYWFLDEVKCIFPTPPLHHLIRVTSSPCWARCASIASVALSLINVPQGTSSIISVALAPYISLVMPGIPWDALYCFFCL